MLQKKYDDFMKDLQANESRVTYIKDLADQLSDEGHPDTEMINDKKTVRKSDTALYTKFCVHTF